MKKEEMYQLYLFFICMDLSFQSGQLDMSSFINYYSIKGCYILYDIYI